MHSYDVLRLRAYFTFPEQEYEAVVQLPLSLVRICSQWELITGGTSTGLLGVWSLLPGAPIDMQKGVKLNEARKKYHHADKRVPGWTQVAESILLHTREFHMPNHQWGISGGEGRYYGYDDISHKLIIKFI